MPTQEQTTGVFNPTGYRTPELKAAITSNMMYMLPVTASASYYEEDEEGTEYSHSGYMRRSIRTPLLTEVIKNSINALSGWERDFDAIAFSGMSGAILAPQIAVALQKNLIMVRKEDDKSTHSCQRVEGIRSCKHYIIIDDFSSSGRTRKYIVNEVYRFAPKAGIRAVNSGVTSRAPL